MKIHAMSILTHIRTHRHLLIRKRSSRGSASMAKIFYLNLRFSGFDLSVTFCIVNNISSM